MSSITHHNLSMIERKYTFESEKLQVDYLTFNIKNSVNNVQKIARYFNNVYKFNCYYYDKKLGIKSKKPYNNLTKLSYTLEMVFVFNANPVNKSTVLIQFSGRNASQFYAILKNQEFNWQIFNLNYLTLCLLAITGVRINELLNIKVSQLKTLTQESWIATDRSKRGPSNHKAFFTKEGKKIIQDRKKDFQFILLIKESDAYVFISEAKHYQKLRREAITKGVNKVTRSVSKQLPGQLNITIHSFRIGYITQLWKDSKDIEFVKQSIGHQKLDTTSAYVNKLSDEERQE